MAVHLTRIYTRTGDDGTTGLSDFSRVSKNDPRLVAYADCDEANSAIGVAIALGHADQEMADMLRQIQNDLFDAGADLSTPVVENPKYPPLRVAQSYIDRLEGWCDKYNEPLPALNSFVLPGGSPLSASRYTKTASSKAGGVPRKSRCSALNTAHRCSFALSASAITPFSESDRDPLYRIGLANFAN